MHPQEERFEHIKDELEKAGIDFDEYRYEEGALVPCNNNIFA